MHDNVNMNGVCILRQLFFLQESQILDILQKNHWFSIAYHNISSTYLDTNFNIQPCVRNPLHLLEVPKF